MPASSVVVLVDPVKFAALDFEFDSSIEHSVLPLTRTKGTMSLPSAAFPASYRGLLSCDRYGKFW